jgi:16S rRNA (guanine527-N7)-methyltransferase
MHDDFSMHASELGVSRETFSMLEAFVDLLGNWNNKMNLVSRDSYKDVWRRHILDSCQIADFIPSPNQVILDIGAGAGFPGLVLAIMGFSKVNLVESNSRKCAFLREAARVVGCTVDIHNLRLDKTVDPQFLKSPPDIITARAVAPLVDLLDIVSTIVYDQTCCIFHKGALAKGEVKEAEKKWTFELEKMPNKLDSSGVILKLSHIRLR